MTAHEQVWVQPGSEAWVRKLCRDAAAVDWKLLERRLVDAVSRDATGSVAVDGHKSSHAAGGAGGGASITVDGEAVSVTSVEASVFAILDDRRRDPVHDHVEAAVGFLDAAVRSAGALVSRLDQVDRVQDPNPPAKRGAAECCERACEDPSVPGKRGRCLACFRWVLRWEEKHPGGQAPPVPADVIGLRSARRIRVSGPGAVDTARIEAR
jgi:hypothetical protein